MRKIGIFTAVVVFVVGGGETAYAQTEDLEPRVAGGNGITTIGFSGFIDKFMSTEDVFPWQATMHVDVMRFVSSRLAVRGGVIGSTTIGGDHDEDSREAGPRARSLQAAGALFYFFTPESMASLYAGGEYRAQLTDRAERDAGSVLGKAGIQAAISSRVATYVEAGYGMRLTRGPDDERQTRIVGALGLRVRF